ncbi:MAG: hypothetical protein ACLUEQ_01180 [Cloacibacillus evryensis]
MKTITLAHYTMKDIDPAPWTETWDNLVKFGSRMAPKLIPLGFSSTAQGHHGRAYTG